MIHTPHYLISRDLRLNSLGVEKQVVHFYYWKASELETAESTDTVPLSEMQKQKIIRVRALLMKDSQLADTLLGRSHISSSILERFRHSLSCAVGEWEAYTLKLRNELVMSLPHWRKHQSIFCAANLEW